MIFFPIDGAKTKVSKDKGLIKGIKDQNIALLSYQLGSPSLKTLKVVPDSLMKFD